MVLLRRLRLLALLAIFLLALASRPSRAQDNPPPSPPPFRYQDLRSIALQKSGMPAEKVDVVILGDGYLRKQLDKDGAFYQDANSFRDHFLAEVPFKFYREMFNFYAVFVESYDEGAEDHPKEDKKRNAFDSTYGVGGIERLLQFQNPGAVFEAAKNAPAVDIIFVLVNDARYGGSGGYVRDGNSWRFIPAPCFSAHGVASLQVAIHELGHSLANLGDEYVDPTVAANYPFPRGRRDLDAPNLTLTRKLTSDDPDYLREHLKWGHFLDLPGAKGVVGLYEGAYFRATGVYRPSERCKMRNYADPYCPVCQEAIVRRLFQITGQNFDDEAYHKAHPIKVK